MLRWGQLLSLVGLEGICPTVVQVLSWSPAGMEAWSPQMKLSSLNVCHSRSDTHVRTCIVLSHNRMDSCTSCISAYHRLDQTCSCVWRRACLGFSLLRCHGSSCGEMARWIVDGAALNRDYRSPMGTPTLPVLCGTHDRSVIHFPT